MDTRFRRRLSFGLIALLLAGGAAFWVTRSASSDRTEGRREPDSASPSPRAPEPKLASQPSPKAAKPPSPAQSEPTPSKADDKPLVLGDGPVRLEVHFVGEGVRPDRVDVYANLEEPQGHSVELRLDPKAPVGHLPKAAKYWVNFTLFTSEGEVSLWESELPFPADGVLSREIRLPVRSVIEVVDATTSAPLASARALVLYASWADRPVAAPDPNLSPDYVLAADDAGHIRLPLCNALSYWWVGAPGHAWAKVRVPAGASTVPAPLAPGGGIRVTIERFADLDEPRVVVTQPKVGDDKPAGLSSPSATPPERADEDQEYDVDLGAGDEPGTFQIDGLPPGRWSVLVGRKGSYKLDEVWGEATVEVVAGQTARTSVATREVKKIARFDVALEVVVPEGWGEDLDEARLSGLGLYNGEIRREVSIGREPGVRRLTLKDMAVGPYQFAVPSIDWQSLVRVRAGESVRVSIPAPALLAARVVDEQGKAVVEGVKVEVRRELGERPERDEAPEERITGVWGDRRAKLSFEKARGLFAGRVAAGRVTIAVTAPDRIDAEVPVTLVPGAAEQVVEVRMRRGAVLEVRILHEGKLAKDAEGDIGVEPHREGDAEDGGSWQRMGGLSGGQWRIDGLEGGPVDVVWIRGRNHDSQKRTVALRAGETTTVEFEDP